MHNIYIGRLMWKFFLHFCNMKILFLFNNRDVRFHVNKDAQSILILFFTKLN